MDRERKTASVRVYGRVQGVFFRAWTVEEAKARGLQGWVRNRADGTVEAVFSGAPENVDDMIAACDRGPPHADVVRVEAGDAPESEAAKYGPGFRQAPTR